MIGLLIKAAARYAGGKAIASTAASMAERKLMTIGLKSGLKVVSKREAKATESIAKRGTKLLNIFSPKKGTKETSKGGGKLSFIKTKEDKIEELKENLDNLNYTLNDIKFTKIEKEFSLIGSSLLGGVAIASIFNSSLLPKFVFKDDDLIETTSFKYSKYKPIKETIAKVESHGGDYNASYNNWAGEIELSSMTVRQVYDMQRHALNTNPKCRAKNGTKSSAIGKYQITSENLNYLVKKKVIAWNDKFTNEAQETMANYLLQKKRGLENYFEGKQSEKETLKQLRKEWAGLKNVSDKELIKSLREEKKSFNDLKDVTNLLTFGNNNTGDLENFRKLNPKFKEQILQMAREYKEKTGKKLIVNSSFRSKKENEKVGGKPNSRHQRGLAIDFNPNQVIELERMGFLKKYHLENGRYWKQPHPEHVQSTDKLLSQLKKQQQEALTIEDYGTAIDLQHQMLFSNNIDNDNNEVLIIKRKFPSINEGKIRLMA